MMPRVHFCTFEPPADHAHASCVLQDGQLGSNAIRDRWLFQSSRISVSGNQGAPLLQLSRSQTW